MYKQVWNESLIAREKKQKLFNLILILIVGILIVALASQILDVFIKTVTASIGSVVLGFGLTSLIGMFFSPAPLDGVLTMINELLQVPWRSKEEELIPFRKKFNGYLLTHRENQNVWLYREFDFGNFELPGYLHANIQYTSFTNKIAKYKYYGFPVKNSLILIGINSNQKNEPPVIQVLPYCGQSGVYAGMAFLETVKGEKILTPTIISDDKLVDWSDSGVIDQKCYENLNAIWNKEFKNRVNLPDTTT